MRPVETSRQQRFEAAYRSLYGPVCGFVLRRVSSPEVAADVVAETFLTLWRRLDDGPPGEALRPWTYGIARRVIANHLRGERRRDALADRLAVELAQVTAQLPDPADGVVEQAGVRAALARLSPRDQDLLRLVAWEGLTADELGVVLGIRPAAARLRLHRARRRLTAALDDPKHEAAGGQVPKRRENDSRIAEGAS